jgi:hypothetical protein
MAVLFPAGDQEAISLDRGKLFLFYTLYRAFSRRETKGCERKRVSVAVMIAFWQAQKFPATIIKRMMGNDGVCFTLVI